MGTLEYPVGEIRRCVVTFKKRQESDWFPAKLPRRHHRPSSDPYRALNPPHRFGMRFP